MAVTGSGVLWMQVEDAVIAQNMHEAILRYLVINIYIYILVYKMHLCIRRTWFLDQ